MRIALYPGTFDPMTLGHLDIIKRSITLVDHLVIGVVDDVHRCGGKEHLFSIEERIDIIKEEVHKITSDIEVCAFSGLLMHFADDVGAQIIIRGLRAVADFEYEFQMVGMNRHLNSKVEIIFLMAEAQYQAISSRLVKEIVFLGGDVTPFVPKSTYRFLKEKYPKWSTNS